MRGEGEAEETISARMRDGVDFSYEFIPPLIFIYILFVSLLGRIVFFYGPHRPLPLFFLGPPSSKLNDMCVHSYVVTHNNSIEEALGEMNGICRCVFCCVDATQVFALFIVD